MISNNIFLNYYTRIFTSLELADRTLHFYGLGAKYDPQAVSICAYMYVVIVSVYKASIPNFSYVC